MRIVSDRRKIHGTQAAALLGPILARHGVERTFPQVPLEIDVRLVANADPETVLKAMPADLDAGYCAVAPKVAIAVQEALREWVPYAVFSDLTEFQYTSAVVTLGYGARFAAGFAVSRSETLVTTPPRTSTITGRVISLPQKHTTRSCIR